MEGSSISNDTDRDGSLMKKAKLSFLYGPKDLRVEKVDLPEPAPDQVLIRVKACGICGSDVG